MSVHDEIRRLKVRVSSLEHYQRGRAPKLPRNETPNARFWDSMLSLIGIAGIATGMVLTIYWLRTL